MLAKVVSKVMFSEVISKVIDNNNNKRQKSKNVRFMTYAEYWIRQSVQRYLEKCGSVIKIPSHTRQKIARCKKTGQESGQGLGRIPTDNEIADKMRISVGLLPELKIQMQGAASLDTPLSDDSSLTLADIVQTDYSLEDDTIDKIYAVCGGSHCIV